MIKMKKSSTFLDISTLKSIFVPSKVPLPGFCCIGITDSCFFKCKMCDKWKEDISVDKKFSKEPTLNMWKRFIFQLSKVVPKVKLRGKMDQRFEINFAGGESLTHPLTLPVVKYANSLGFRTVIPSNAYLINDAMAKKLHDSGLSAINLSLDSLDPKIHDKFRGFDGAHEGVMKAIKALKKYNYPKAGIISIIHNSTYAEIKDIIEWVDKHEKLDWILTMAIMQPNNTVFESGWYEKKDFEELWPKDKSKMIKVIEDIIEIKKDQIRQRKSGLISNEKLVNTLHQLYAFKKYFNDPEIFVKNNQPCNFDTALQVSAVGDIYMCYHYHKLGNIHNDDFRKVWKSNNAKLIRKHILKCKTNCHELINCYYKDEYPFSVKNETKTQKII